MTISRSRNKISPSRFGIVSLKKYNDVLFSADGFAQPNEEPDHAIMSKGVNVKIYKIEKAGFLISDKEFYYQKFLKSYPKFTDNNFYLIKEWEIIEERKKFPFSQKLFEAQENRLGDPTLLTSAYVDRRIIFGKNYPLTQTYKPRYTTDQMKQIVQKGASSIEEILDVMKPSLVISFLCNTFCEYIVYQYAQSNQIRFFNFRPAKVDSYFIIGDTVSEPSIYVKNAYNFYRDKHNFNPYYDKAVTFINNSKNTNLLYEGVILPSDKPQYFRDSLLKKVTLFPKALIKTFLGFLGKYKLDPHNPSPISFWFYVQLLMPIRALIVRNKLKNKYASVNNLKNLRYAFFPLHTEPEVSLFIYSWPFKNQIEAVRNIAQSLPANMILLVKEHPASIGKRPLKFYKKLLEIPNVKLMDPRIPSKFAIDSSSLVTVLSSSVGFEAALNEKPVLTFGDTSFEILPNSMVLRNKNLFNLKKDIKFLVESYSYNEGALISFISAIYNTGVNVNFYSDLLQKKKAYKTSSSSFDQQIHKLSRYVIDFFSNEFHNITKSNGGTIE